MKKGMFVLIMLGMLGTLSTGCKKEETNSGYLTVKMTDAPGDYDQVNVDIQRVEIKYAGFNGWMSAATNAGVYDLLLLMNNVTAVLTDHVSLPSGRINQMRMILGSNNTVVVQGVAHPLVVPSGLESGLKINVTADVQMDANLEVVLDFDAAQSVVLNGDGTYHLKPVIKVQSINYN